MSVTWCFRVSILLHFSPALYSSPAHQTSLSDSTATILDNEERYGRLPKFQTLTEDILGRTKTRLQLREDHIKDPLLALAKALACLENLGWGWHLV